MAAAAILHYVGSEVKYAGTLTLLTGGSRMLPGKSWGGFHLTNQQNTVIYIAHKRLKMLPQDAF